MPLKILIKRDTVQNFKTSEFVPKYHELVAAYDEHTKNVIYKLGDGVTPWAKLKKITRIKDLDCFIVYSQVLCGPQGSRRTSIGPEIYLNPFKINEVLSEIERLPIEQDKSNTIKKVETFIEEDSKTLC